MLLDRIRRVLARLPPAERRVAELILDKPNVTVTWTITDAANFAGVSEPSVIRLCRKVGCDGFPALKLELAQTLSRLRTTDREEIGRGDPLGSVARHVFERSMHCIEEARADLDVVALGNAIDRIVRARRLEIYGFGVSGFIAADAQHQLASLGINAIAYSDPYLQSSSAPLLISSDVLLAVSLSGRTGFLVESTGLAKSAGACIITLAPAGSPLAAAADIQIPINVHREERAFTPLSARLAFLAVLDIISFGVSLRLAEQKTNSAR